MYCREYFRLLIAFNWSIGVTASRSPISIATVTDLPFYSFTAWAGRRRTFTQPFRVRLWRIAGCSLSTILVPAWRSFDPALTPDVSALADIAQLVSEKLLPKRYFICAASMGGLIALLKLRQYGADGVNGFVNIEGNLLPEDCMFSRRTASHDPEQFRTKVFPEMISELLRSPHTGDRVIAHNMALNTDARAYYSFSHETVRESDSGNLINEFLALDIPRLFLYGEVNRSLSYLERLRQSIIEVVEIPRSAHFLFYDNPVRTFDVIGEFVHRHDASSSNIGELNSTNLMDTRRHLR
jgi:pimeloyl-ACP methyl ester carboxylesterase